MGWFSFAALLHDRGGGQALSILRLYRLHCAGRLAMDKRGPPAQNRTIPFCESRPDTVLHPFALFLILLGPAMGSFLALLADRLPRGEDVIRRPSACRACGARLGLRDLLPLVGFVLAGGRCRSCGAVIPPWLLYSEILATGAGLLAVLAGGPAPDMALNALFLWLLLGLGLTDLLWFRLPDLMTGALCLVAGTMALRPGAMGGEMALLGAALGVGSFLALRLGYRALRGREGLGLGDVKLMAGLGAFAGAFDLALLVLLAALLGLAGGLVGHLRRPGASLRRRAIPFGSALCAAGALLWLARATALLN